MEPRLDACPECGGKTSETRFCSRVCRQRFHNRRMQRGAKAYDVLMSMRFERTRAKGAWSLLCRMASEFRRLDIRDREGRPSWDELSAVKARSAHVAAKVVGVNVVGGSRRSARSK